MNTPVRINIEVLNDAALVQVIRRVVAATLSEVGISESNIDAATLLIGEACGNVVRHAYDWSALYEVGLEFGGDFIDMEVLDYGRGFDSSVKPQFGHFGLSIMSAIDPNIHIESKLGEGTMVSAHIPVVYDAPCSVTISAAVCLCEDALKKG